MWEVGAVDAYLPVPMATVEQGIAPKVSNEVFITQNNSSNETRVNHQKYDRY